ncbi:hypothetical protein BVRB_2g024680 [Beta vulgaris subsp. vulgaris]|uniref:uncharacterized protein LOC104904051 n=1 Tax=Beta vulgaris subsp. vulgaris TaxID=3555 RepID=UPI000540180B|nr:uncharacterized protein LOC104904051 [Beta vulgaris subsp. vulgaris]KMT18307.1 hypothetical protein BVRB_2g024680 [Beta vulgaris subsp. vulgaris]
MQQPTKKPTKNSHSHKKHKHIHPNNNYNHPQPPTTTTTSNISFQRNTDVKGLKFGGQFIVKSFTVRRSTPLELSLLLNLSPPKSLSSTITFLPSNFTILAHHAWHTLTLGLGTKKSKIIIFVFNNVVAKSELHLTWPSEIPLGDVNKKLIRGLNGWDFARFKFRKGCITFYVFAVRRCGEKGFQCAEDLRCILQSVISLNDFLDHTAMLALPHQRSIDHHSSNNNNTTHPVSAH